MNHAQCRASRSVPQIIPPAGDFPLQKISQIVTVSPFSLTVLPQQYSEYFPNGPPSVSYPAASALFHGDIGFAPSASLQRSRLSHGNPPSHSPPPSLSQKSPLLIISVNTSQPFSPFFHNTPTVIFFSLVLSASYSSSFFLSQIFFILM